MTAPGGAVILCVNCGSSSVKTAVYELGAAGEIQRAAVSVDGAGPDALAEALRVGDGFASTLTGAGHRLVHGGPHHFDPTRLDEQVIGDLRAATPFAPLHLPAALAGIDAVARRYPDLPQVACFDTAFHRSMPETAWRLPLPSGLADVGVRRYGFHGLSYEYIVATLGGATLGRAVVAHLGNGASLAAVEGGRSVHTTMGFTPSGGIVMSGRSGDLDPGIFVYLTRERGYDGAALEELVDRESGLRALSGETSDMQTLLERRAGGDDRAALAVTVFCQHVRMQIGAYAALLGGLDTVVFTAGIGAHAPAVRAEACRGLEHLGVMIDEDSNAASEPVISAPASPVTVRVLETNEDVMIARHTQALLG
ncbi:MAG TPA: acetate/propionate family kinase [Acidimicrobiia bacterium]|nr:acetate/propionate family kinase [Acidimicrobiia bacterium]